jgi:hypothetical protein
MTVNNYRFPNTGIERQIQIPFEQVWDNVGRDDLIDEFENEVVEQVINPIEDFEVARFEHKPYQGGLTKIYYDFDFFPNSLNVTSASLSDYSTNYTAETFTYDEIYYGANSFTQSFFKLDFYDTPDSETQNIYLTLIFPTQQGQKIQGIVGQGSNAKNVEIETPNFQLDYIGDKEGFFVYWLKSREYINIDEFYVSAKFFNAKIGEFVRFMTTPQVSLGTPFTFNKSQYFYHKVMLDYNTYEYVVETMGGQRIGDSATNPIKWYEYVNP